jgi:6-phosphogluconolactonase
MSKKMYALVGNFGFAPGPKGLQVFNYDPATAGMELIESVFDDVNVGHQSIDAARNIAYIINECPSLRGQTGGGGYLMAVKIDPASGKLSLINEKPTLSADPCYTSLDGTGRYILVSHHTGYGFVTRIVKSEKGYLTESFFDDTALVLFRINEDGSLGDVCDISLTSEDKTSGPHTWSRQNSVIASPTGELIVVCDRGLDKFHTYRLDRENGKLVPLHSTKVEPGLVPRYGVFHPSLPIFYANFQKKPLVRAYRYDAANGNLDLTSNASLLPDEKAVECGAELHMMHPKSLHEKMQMEKMRGNLDKLEPAGILIHPNGKYVYASLRGENTIAVLDVDSAGAISLKESIDCGGKNPRGLTISPDARFLFAANMDSGNVATFSIGNDGSLQATGKEVKARCPGSIKIIES